MVGIRIHREPVVLKAGNTTNRDIPSEWIAETCVTIGNLGLREICAR